MFRRSMPFVAAVAIMALGPGAIGQDFNLDWHTIDAGGAMFTSGGNFQLSGTIGQPDAGSMVMVGGDFSLAGGFWPGAVSFCFGNLNGDGEVGLADLAQLLGHYGTPSGGAYADGDLDGDGDVDLADLANLLGKYGTVCP